jgi:microcystin degradation protein MlrC
MVPAMHIGGCHDVFIRESLTCGAACPSQPDASHASKSFLRHLKGSQMRIGVVSVMQETNTFSGRPCRWADFTTAERAESAQRLQGTNSEFAGALEALAELGVDAVPIFYAWAMPSGRVESETFRRLQSELARSLTDAGQLDGLVLSLHGAMVTEDIDDADLALIHGCRRILGQRPIGVCLDLHANVTVGMIESADLLIGYRTDPHVDMAETGQRSARLLVALLEGRVTPTLALEKRAMIIPAEAMNTSTGVLAEIRQAADSIEHLLDVSLFPVQPWLDVPEHGFGVVATSDGDPQRAVDAVKSLADAIWTQRDRFVIPRLVTPSAAYALARTSSVRPFLVAESADAPSAGAAGDSPAMVEASFRYGKGLETMLTLVDPSAVARCQLAGAGAKITTEVGAALDQRYSRPVLLEGTVERVGAGRFKLEGVGYHGLEASMGGWAVIRSPGVTVLVTD